MVLQFAIASSFLYRDQELRAERKKKGCCLESVLLSVPDGPLGSVPLNAAGKAGRWGAADPVRPTALNALQTFEDLVWCQRRK